MRRREAALNRMMVGLRILLGVMILLLVYALLGTIQMHRPVPLGNGYKYYHWSSGMANGVVILLAPDSCESKNRGFLERANCKGVDDNAMPKHEVGPDVDGYCVYRKIITGHITSRTKDADGYRIPDSERGVPGYFVIDVRKDVFYDGLSKQEWLKRLHSFGLTSEPKLFKPSLLDEWLGRNKPSAK